MLNLHATTGLRSSLGYGSGWTRERSDVGRGSPGVIVDFRAARRQVERQSQYPGSTRRSAFAAYVSLFELADDDGRVEVPSAQLAAALDTTRMSWLSFRDVLVAAGLLSVGAFRGGGRPIVLQLHAPGELD